MAKKWYQKATVQTAIVSGILLVIGIGIPYIFRVPTLKNKIDQLEKENSNKTAEIQRLETQLTPFRTIALEKYTGSEQEALKKLAEEFENLKTYVNPLKKPIAYATAEVEVTITSDEQVSVTYMDVGGYLVFLKDQQPLLSLSDTKSSACQIGNGKVRYKGNFQIQADISKLNEPVEILGTSDIIQIHFVEIPPNSEIIKGKADVIINGELRFQFVIPSQKMKGDNLFIKKIKEKFLKTSSSGP